MNIKKPFLISIFILVLLLVFANDVSASTDNIQENSDKIYEDQTLEDENYEQYVSTATGLVTLTILPPPEICGDGFCTKSEDCVSCPDDCGFCRPSQTLAGLMSGNRDMSIFSLYSVLVYFGFILFFLFATIGNLKIYFGKILDFIQILKLKKYNF
ncbi:MAG: hypothetical protein QW051_01315 [Candidatus Aenigmatarchaeota archaeon]